MQPVRQTVQYFRFLLEATRDPRLQGITGAAIGLIAVGSLFFWLVEGWKPLDAVYFSVMALTTVGFGDFAPRTAPGKMFTIVYVLLGVGLFGSFLALVAKRAVERLERRPPAAKGDEGGTA